MLYDYICSNCSHEWNDVKQSMKDKPKKKCPECGKHALQRVLYGGAYVFVSNANTVGQLADRNRKDMGHYQRSELDDKAKEKLTNTDSNKVTSREINKMTTSQKQKYITEGQK
jgi:putative FmdB family regulatory protein